MGTEIDGVNGIIKNTTSDGDITIKGNDGGSEISALVFDISAAGAATFNDKITAVGTSVFTNLDISGDIDVDGTTNLDVVDIDGAVNMATTALVTGVLTTTATAVFNGGFTSNDGVTISTADVNPQLTIISTEAGGDQAPLIDLYRNSSTPADGDVLGQINYYGENSADEKITYVRTRAGISDVTDGDEGSNYTITTYTAGAQYGRLNILETESVFNENSADIDFRVESDGVDKMLFVNAGTNTVSIGGEATPLGRLHVFTADSSASAHANADELVIEGSAYSGMTIASGTSSHGTIAFADSGDELAGRIIYNHSTNAMSFGTAGTGTQWSINSDGNLLPGSSTGQGIHLGVTSAGAANLLDDYEEGTFTYAINGSNSGNLVLRSGYARGEYVKVGNVVHIDLRFETSSDNSISGNLQWTLPFTKANPNANDAGNSVTVGYIRDNSLGTNYRTGVYLVGQSEAYAQLLFSREGAVTSTVELANDGNTDGVLEGVISITYRTT